jgi:hypothetical protein
MWVDVGIIEIWALLHLGHVGFGVASLRRLRGWRAWTAIALSAAAAIVPFGSLLLALVGAAAPRAYLQVDKVAQLAGMPLRPLIWDLLTWFSLPVSVVSVFLDLNVRQRAASLAARLCGLAATAYLLAPPLLVELWG